MDYLNGKKTARIRVVSSLCANICFDITVPEDCVDKVKDLAFMCGETWYDEECAEVLCEALEKQGITYILHEDVVEEPDDWAEFC